MRTKIPNRPRAVMRVALVVALILLLAVIAIPMFTDSLMEWGFGVMALMIFAMVAALVTAIVYRGMAREFDRAYSGNEWLVEWTYTDDEWRDYHAEDSRRRRSSSWGLFRLMAAVAFVVTVVMALVYKTVFFLGLYAGLMTVLMIPAYAAPRMQEARLRREPIVRIGKRAMSVGGWFRPMTGTGIQITVAELVEKDGKQFVHIEFAAPTLTGPQAEPWWIPVPERYRAEAAMAVQAIAASR
jgi:hypothetical protein